MYLFQLPALKQNNYCPRDPMNYPLSGSMASERLSAPPVLMLDADVTGMAITRVAEKFTVLVITTDEGELVKVRSIIYSAIQSPFVSSEISLTRTIRTTTASTRKKFLEDSRISSHWTFISSLFQFNRQDLVIKMNEIKNFSVRWNWKPCYTNTLRIRSFYEIYQAVHGIFVTVYFRIGALVWLADLIRYLRSWTLMLGIVY